MPFLDQTEDLVDAGLSAVVQLAGGAGSEPADQDGEDERPEDGSELLIEGAVDEDVVSRRRARHAATSSWQTRS